MYIESFNTYPCEPKLTSSAQLSRDKIRRHANTFASIGIFDLYTLLKML